MSVPPRNPSISQVEANSAPQNAICPDPHQETLALLKLLALGRQDIEAGRTRAAHDIVARLSAKREAENS